MYVRKVYWQVSGGKSLRMLIFLSPLLKRMRRRSVFCPADRLTCLRRAVRA